jgi:hypothetical protein
MVRPLEYTVIRETKMNNLEKLQPTTDCGAYKHSMDECSVKLNGIKHLLDRIALSTYDVNSKHMAESAQALCDELLRELTQP